MATRRENEAIGGLLRRNLSRQAAANCLDPDQLAAYFEHSLSATECVRCEAHLSSCARCREQLAAMIRADESPEAGAAEPQRSHTWLLDWRGLTAAAAVLAIVAVWTVRRSERIAKAPAQKAPFVTMARQDLPYPSPAAPAANLKLPAATSENRLGHGKRLPPAEGGQVGSALESAESFAPTPPREPPSRGAAAAARVANVPEQSGTGAGTEPGMAAGRRAIAPPPAKVRSFSSAPEIASAAPSAAAEQNSPRAETSGAEQLSAQPTAARADSSAHPARPQPGPVSQAVTVEATPALELGAAGVQQTIEQRTSGNVIDTPNPSVKWRITQPGFIERTENGGATWFGEQIEPDASLLAASAPDAKTCWAVGRNGAVYVTKDGKTWKKANSPSTADLVAVSAKSASSAIVTTASGERFSTRNAGNKWKQLPASPDSNQP
jgi:hypothetical protein